MTDVNDQTGIGDIDDTQNDGIFDAPHNKKTTLNEIRKKILELSKTIDLSDVTAPDCEINNINTRGICVAYIVFVIFSFIGLIGIFIWRFFHNRNRDEKKRPTEDVTV